MGRWHESPLHVPTFPTLHPARCHLGHWMTAAPFFYGRSKLRTLNPEEQSPRAPPTSPPQRPARPEPSRGHGGTHDVWVSSSVSRLTWGGASRRFVSSDTSFPPLRVFFHERERLFLCFKEGIFVANALAGLSQGAPTGRWSGFYLSQRTFPPL